MVVIEVISYDCTIFLHSLLTKGKLQVLVVLGSSDSWKPKSSPNRRPLNSALKARPCGSEV